jgi:hypothetical protein
MERTWQDNAHEFGALVRQGKDVRLALLVACSVVRSPGRVAIATLAPKTNATTYAIESLGTKTGAARVLRHLDAWDRRGMARFGRVG